jgi:eukaryotic-like serine/threonine-protein kinase
MDASSMKAGQVVAGRYRLEARLGVGGMGEVWSAVHIGTGRDFAIKFMHAHAAASQSARQRFSREARASAKINHPNIIDVFDVGEMEDGVLYLVMELLSGVSLADALHAEPALSIQDLLAVLLDTAQALAAAHAVGIVHRDVKPANIFLHKERGTGFSFAKILDFGISKFTDDDQGTKTGSILGSPRYMSPEQTRSAAAADPKADIWALGVVLFEGLTGTWPHEGDSFSSLVVNICTVPPLSIDAVAPHLPEPLRAIVRECLLPYPERLKSAESFAERVELALEDAQLASMPLPRPLRAAGEGIKSTTGLRVRPPTSMTRSGSGPRSHPSGSPSAASRPPFQPPAPPAWPSGFAPPPYGHPADAAAAAHAYAPSSEPHAAPHPGSLREPLAPEAVAAQPSADPLVSSVSSLNVETIAIESAQRRAAPGPPPAAAPPALPDPAIPPPQARNPNRTLGIAAAVLAITLTGIIIALVSTIRSHPSAAVAPEASVAASGAASPTAAPEARQTASSPHASATPVGVPAPAPRSASSDSAAEPTTPSPASSSPAPDGTSSGARRRTPAGPKRMRVQDLGDGL